jgi:hypothetical protein
VLAELSTGDLLDGASPTPTAFRAAKQQAQRPVFTIAKH